nr:hypothetical protein [Tanacetum cinerariifolium]
MALTFANPRNMIAYLTKSDASEGFDQIINFLNGSSIKYALTVNPNIYVSCIKQFWTFVSVKTVNDVPRLKALVDKKKDVKEIVVEKSANVEESANVQERKAESQAQIYQIDLEHANKVLSIFGVDAAEEFKENMLSDYCCQAKLMLLINAAKSNYCYQAKFILLINDAKSNYCCQVKLRPLS